MPEYRFSRRITPMDVHELLKHKGVKPSDITVEEDGDEVRIIIQGATLTPEKEAKLENPMKLIRRKKTKKHLI